MLPTLSIIVPSYNQAQYIEETLLSIIDQNYPGLELIVIDGGSTDGSVDIIEKYSKHIAYWVSEPDRGQSHAINKGLEKASGEWIAWLNSDDCYLPGSLLPIFQQDQTGVDFIYGNCVVGVDSKHTRPGASSFTDKNSLFDILRFFHAPKHIIPSQSVFIRKSLIAEIGNLREDLHYCMDLDWYCRVFLATEKRRFIDPAVAFFRNIPTTKTSSHGGKMIEEAMAIAEQYATFLPLAQQQRLKRLIAYDTKLFSVLKSNKLNLWTALGILLKWPVEALSDNRFRIKVKAIFS